MKKGLTEIVFILDRSGSMSGLESDTIGGYNAFLEKQKNAEGEALVSTILFNEVSKVVHNRIPVKEVEPMKKRHYSVGGCTALLDAIGGAVHHIKKIHKESPDEEVPEKTIFVITTDGMENSSHKYDYEKIKKLISKQQEKHKWEFLFLGANIDAIGEAARLGIPGDCAVRYECDRIGTQLNFSVLSDVILDERKGLKKTKSWCRKINEYESREK